MSIDKAVTAIAEAIVNLANAGNNIAQSVNRYCDLTEAQDRVMFEGFAKHGTVTGRIEGGREHLTNTGKTERASLAETVPAIDTAIIADGKINEAAEADPIGDAIKADRDAAAKAKKAADAVEKAEAKAEAAKMIADAKALTDASKAKKAEADEAQDVAPSTPSEKEAEPSEYDVMPGSATYDETRAVLITAVTTLGKLPVAELLKENFAATNIKALTEAQNAKFIRLLQDAMADADIPF